MNEEVILTPNGYKVLSYMQDHDEVLVGKDMIDLTGIKGIYPVLNSLIRHNLVSPAEPIVRPFTNNKGETKDKEYKTYSLTDAGRAFIIR